MDCHYINNGLKIFIIADLTVQIRHYTIKSNTLELHMDYVVYIEQNNECFK